MAIFHHMSKKEKEKANRKTSMLSFIGEGLQ